MTVNKPLLDGEKIPEADLRRIFQSPPGLSLDLTRSTLLVGSRGVGKTTLLRYSATTDPSNTLYLSLLHELGAIVRDSAALPDGVGAVDFFHRQGAKAECLLTVASMRELHKKRPKIDLVSVADTLPASVRGNAFEPSTEWFKAAQKRVYDVRDETWDSVVNAETFRHALGIMADQLRKVGGDLKVFLDRADMVPAFAVAPMIRLLDQTGAYYLLVATRPAPFADPDWGLSGSVRPQDHYCVMQVCAHPREAGWRHFMNGAIRAQYQVDIERQRMPDHVLDAAVYFARDSVRLCLEIVYQTLSDHRGSWADRLDIALSTTRQDLVRTSDATLKRWQKRFSRTLDEWRERVLKQEKTLSLKGPVVISLTTGTSQPFLVDATPVPTSLDRFVAAGLSVGALSPPPGDGWYPGCRLEAVEVPPLLLWSAQDRPPAHAASSPIVVEMTASTFSGSSGRRPPKGSAFVGYRFDFPESRAFYEHLRRAIAQHPQLESVTLLHGKLPPGTEWAEKIRRRIVRSRLLVIADVTGGRGDLLFELGVGWGLQRPIMPVLSTHAGLDDVPRWLRTFNFGYYETPADVDEIAAAISDHMYNRAEYRPRRVAAPVPGVMGLVGRESWNDHAYARLQNAGRLQGFQIHDLPAVSDANISLTLEHVARASLLVLPVDGTAETDPFTHFAAGVAVAQPLVGQKKAGFLRRVIILREDLEVAVPDSIVNCQTIVNVVTSPAEAIAAIDDFISVYRAWFKSGRRTSEEDQ